MDAARAYNRAAKDLHGSAAKLNLLPDEGTVGFETKTVAVTSVITRIEDRGTKDAESDPQEGKKGETDEYLSAPAVNASGANEGVAIESTATVVSSKLEDVGQAANATPTRNATSSLSDVGTLNVDGNAEAYGVGAQTEPIEGLTNATTADFGVGVGGTQNESINLPPAEVSVIGNDSLFLPELDFRDLEEIPMSAGPSLTDDSTWWQGASSEAHGRLSSEINRNSESFSRISDGGTKVSLPLELELTSDLEKIAKVGDVSAEEIGISEIPSSMPIQSDCITSSSGSRDTKCLPPVMAVTPDASREGPVLSSSQSDLKPCLAEEPGGSSQTLLALPGAELKTASFGFDGPSRLHTLEDTSSLDHGAVAVSPPGATASAHNDVISGEGGVINEGTGDSGGRDENAWCARAPVETGGWEWDNTGEDLYEEKLKGVVDVRCVSTNGVTHHVV